MKNFQTKLLSVIFLSSALLLTLSGTVSVLAQDMPAPTAPTNNLAIPLPGNFQSAPISTATSQTTESQTTQSNQNNISQARIPLTSAATISEQTSPTVRTGGLPLAAMLAIPLLIVAVYAYSYYKKNKKVLHTQEIKLNTKIESSKKK